MTGEKKQFSFSIVTPSYNQGRFVEKTIQSVLSQKGDFFIDYIIADGGSSDNSVQIIKKYDELFKTKGYPIKCKGIEYSWWSRKDKGQSDAINQGFKIARGNILAWINSDDFYEPESFACAMQAFKNNPDIDLINGDVRFIKEETGEKKIFRSEQGNFLASLQGTFKLFQPSTFFAKRIVHKVGFLDENLHYAMDYDLFVRILSEGKSLYLPKVLSNFRVWGDSKTSPQKEKDILSPTGNENKDFKGMVKDLEYLLEKHHQWLETDPLAYSWRLVKLGSMNFLAGDRNKSLKYLLQSIKTKPSTTNVFTLFSILLGKRFHWYLLKIRRKIAKETVE